MKSISFYLVFAYIRLKRIKSIFSIAPIDYLKLRKSTIKFPNKKLLLNQEAIIIKVNKSILTEIVPEYSEGIENIILYCPGGAFVYGPTDINWMFCATIAKRTNLRTFVVDYPKAPEFGIEEINTNIDAIYNFLAEQKAISNIILIGDSVGGTLLILLIQRLLKQKYEILSNNIILMSPVIDCSMTNPKIAAIDKKDVMLSQKGILSAKQMCARSVDLKSEAISPIYGKVKNFIDTYIFIGENDIMQPDQELFVEKLDAENIFVKVFRGSQSPHIWPLLPFMKEANESVNEIVCIIKKIQNKL